MASPNSITKNELIAKLKDIRAMGWICSTRQGNQGGVGNTLEDLLGIKENNLPIPNAAEWELKCQREGSYGRAKSLQTLFHLDPSPRVMSLVTNLLLPKYGWPHARAGEKYPPGELSFRQTINAGSRTDRGFGVVVDRDSKRVTVSFDATAVSSRHSSWLASVESRVGLAELDPQPYWGFDDLFHVAATKLLNCFHVLAEVKRESGKECFHYSKILMLERFSQDRFISAIADGDVLVDFDARSGHNHGTKFRLRPSRLTDLYDLVTQIS